MNINGTPEDWEREERWEEEQREQEEFERLVAEGKIKRGNCTAAARPSSDYILRTLEARRALITKTIAKLQDRLAGVESHIAYWNNERSVK
jgi:hypothetical protein